MIVVTGAAGFIAGNLVKRLQLEVHRSIVLVDDVHNPKKAQRLSGFKTAAVVARETFPEWLTANAAETEFVFHLGARTDTTEMNFRVLDSLNLSFSKSVAEICMAHHVPWLYASSAATYGAGENGFDDNESLMQNLKPLNPYGLSKHLFDLHMLQLKPKSFWAGLKFFNVFGPGEENKGRMASVAFHAYQQIKQTGKLKLFQSHRNEYADGEQLRDFVYVDDVVEVCLHFYRHRLHPGIYNVGSGCASSFNQLAAAIFKSMHLPYLVEYIPIPQDIRDKYQYHTIANIAKLRSHGFNRPFVSLEEGIAHYVHYLQTSQPTQP